MSVDKQNRANFPRVGFWSQLIYLALSALILFIFSQAFRYAPCWGLFFLAAISAWPIWHYQKEYLLFQRRAVLTKVADAESWLRRWFWAGSISKILQVFSALFWATLLLAFCLLLTVEQWMVLIVDIFFIVLITKPVSHHIASGVRDEHVGMMTRRWPLLLLNLLFLAAAFVAIDFFIVGAPDTRGMAWHAVAESAFAQGAAMATCPLTGWLVGTLAAIEGLSWHASEILIPTLPQQDMKWAAWGIFLLQAGVLAYVYTRLQLGVLAIVEGRKSLSKPKHEGIFSRAFFVTILILAIPYLYATFKLSDFDVTKLEKSARGIVAWINPCQIDQIELLKFEQSLNVELNSARVVAQQRGEASVIEALDDLFTDVEQGVDRYLDWYFTVIGEYERLAALAVGDFAELMTTQLEQHLFSDTGFGNKLETVSRDIAQDSEAQMKSAAAELGEQLRTNTEHDPCIIGEVNLAAIDNFNRDQLRASAAVGGGAAVGAATAKILASKSGAAVAAKITAKKSFQMAGSLASKVVAKKGGSVLLSSAGAALACSPGGLLAAICGVVAGGVAWISFDKAFIEIDEARFRDEMRAEILDSLGEQKIELLELLKSQNNARINAMTARIQASLERAFIPAQDGIY